MTDINQLSGSQGPLFSGNSPTPPINVSMPFNPNSMPLQEGFIKFCKLLFPKADDKTVEKLAQGLQAAMVNSVSQALSRQQQKSAQHRKDDARDLKEASEG